MDRLEFIKREVIELAKMAREEREGMLAYLLELAVAEADDEIKKRRNRAKA